MTRVKKVTISLPEDVLQTVDGYAQMGDKSRSFIIREAVEAYIKEDVESRTIIEAAEIYAQIEESDIRLSEKFLGISSETLPRSRKDNNANTS
ncbi:MAG: ribbon-helix-helix protein, CopG family [Actinobacteria bacterium]|nr:ribbon-helix-helix protein, CopG family [Actinomycetota bacterium]